MRNINQRKQLNKPLMLNAGLFKYWLNRTNVN